MYLVGYTQKRHRKTYKLLKDMIQEELVNLVGARRETILRLKAEKYNTSLKLALDIAKILKCPIEELFILE